MIRGALISPESEPHQAFCRLYDLARQVHRGSGRRPDLWSGELRVRDDGFGPFGTYNSRTGAMTFSSDMMHGLMSDTAGERGDALATMLHEALHAMRHEESTGNAAAVRGKDALALDEGLVEYVTDLRLSEYAQVCGSEEARPMQSAHIGPRRAVTSVLTFAVGEAKAGALAEKLMHEPCDLDFRGLASAIVESHLGNVAAEPSQRAAATKAVQRVLRRAPWAESLDDATKGAEIEQHLPDLLEGKIEEIRTHHRSAATPFRDRSSDHGQSGDRVEQGDGERHRAVSLDRPQPPSPVLHPMCVALAGVVHARHSVRAGPSLPRVTGRPRREESRRHDQGEGTAR